MLLASLRFQVVTIRIAVADVADVAYVAVALVDAAVALVAVANVVGDICAVLLSYNHHKIRVVVPNNISH